MPGGRAAGRPAEVETAGKLVDGGGVAGLEGG